jgi:predicted aldo/keto reductase-like oxidoreductase
MVEAMRYALSHPLSTVIVGCDNIAQLEENVSIARSFVPMSEGQLIEVERKAESVSEQGQWYKKR